MLGTEKTIEKYDKFKTLSMISKHYQLLLQVNIPLNLCFLEICQFFDLLHQLQNIDTLQVSCLQTKLIYYI